MIAAKFTELDEASVSANWSRLIMLVQQHAPKCIKLLATYADGVLPKVAGDNFICGLYHAPAGKGMHHNYVGGLVQHYLEMWDYYQILISGMRKVNDITTMSAETLNPGEVLSGIILHDLHKGYLHFQQNVDGSMAYCANAHAGLLQQNHKTVYMASSVNLTLSVLDLNVIFSSEGGWATDPAQDISVLAKFVYLLDELSVLHFRLSHERLLSCREQPASYFTTI